MRITRKFNLSRIGLKYESVDIEVEGEDKSQIIVTIDEIWRTYIEAIKKGLVQ